MAIAAAARGREARRAEGGLVPALEIMLNEALIRDLIMKGSYEKITDVIEQNNPMGMCSFDQSLLELFAKGLITEETVISQADKASDMKVKLQQVRLGKADSGLHNIDTSIFSVSD